MHGRNFHDPRACSLLVQAMLPGEAYTAQDLAKRMKVGIQIVRSTLDDCTLHGAVTAAYNGSRSVYWLVPEDADEWADVVDEACPR